MTLAYPQWALVDAPSLDANVLVDFNPHGYKASGFSLGAPDFLGDPDSISPELGFRSISGAVIIEGSDAEMAAWLSQAQRALMRPRAFMLWCPTPDSEPLWAHTYQSASGPLSWDLHRFKASDENRLVLPLTITADPGLLGEQESFELTIGNDPSDGGCFAALPEIKGDLPAPLRFSIPDPDRTGTLSVFAVPEDVTLGSPLRFMVTDWDAGTDVTTSAAQSDMILSGGSYYECDFGTEEGMDIRLDVADMHMRSSSASDAQLSLAGVFRVFMRMAGDGSGDEADVRVQLGQASGSDYQWNDPAAFFYNGASSLRRWVDLGLISTPFGNPVVASEVGADGIGPAALAIRAERLSGSAGVAFDDCVLVPVTMPGSVGSSLAKVKCGESALALTTMTVDSDSSPLRVRSFDEDDIPLSLTASASATGSPPMVWPGWTCVLHRLHSGGQVDADELLTFESTLTVSYFPRYLGLPS